MFDIRWGEGGTVVLAGRFDASQAERAEAFFAEVVGPTTLDCRDLEYISSLGLGTLLRTQKRLGGGAAGLRLVGMSRHIREVFRFSGFDRLFEIEDATQARPGGHP